MRLDIKDLNKQSLKSLQTMYNNLINWSFGPDKELLKQLEDRIIIVYNRKQDKRRLRK